MADDLQAFISLLDQRGELLRITEPVNPLLDIATIADRVSKMRCVNTPSQQAIVNDPNHWGLGGPALLFENVIGSDFPLLINAYGSYSRMELALGGRAFDDVAAQIRELVKPQPPRTLRELIAKAKQFAPLLRIPPKSVRRGACQQVIYQGSAIDLTKLPVIRCWEHDGNPEALGYPAGTNENIAGVKTFEELNGTAVEQGGGGGRYITLAGIHTIHADDAGADKPSSHNIGMYRVQILGKDRVAMHWHMHHDGASHWRSWKKLGKPMPVAIVLGGEPILPYAATAPLPPGISELLMAGFLNKRGIELVNAVTVPLRVPARAEIVIEGFVRHDAGPIGWDPRDPDSGALGDGAVFEGPFGDHTGFYSLPDRYPILEVTAITHRRNAVYPTTVVGLPPQEDYYLGKATERVFLPLLQTLVHDIEDYDLPMFGAFHNCAFLRIKKAYPLQARRVMHAIWGAGQMAWTKYIFVVDEDVNVHDHAAVMRALASHCRPIRDTEAVTGPLDILDHAAPRLGSGTKMGFDCTRRIPGEDVDGEPIQPPFRGELPVQAILDAVRGVPGVINAAIPEGGGHAWLNFSITRPSEGGGSRAILSQVLQALEPFEHAPPMALALDDSVNPESAEEALFHWCASTDAGRDTLWSPSNRTLGFDATTKHPGTAGPPHDDAHRGQAVREWPTILTNNSESLQRVEPILKGILEKLDALPSLTGEVNR